MINQISKYLLIFSFLFIVNCNSLRIEHISSVDDDLGSSQIFTQNFNYQRNLLSKEELSPPLKLVIVEDYNGMPSNSFSFIDSILFLGTHKGYIFALNINNLKVIGKKKYGQSAPNPPTIYKNFLYQTYDKGDCGLIAYDFIEGDKIWEIEDNITSSSAIVVENKVFFQSNDGKVNCVNYLTGENIWIADLKMRGINSIAYNNNILISANQDGGIFAIEYSSGVILWEKKLKDKIFANPVIDKSNLYISTYKGSLYQLNINNGKTIHLKQFDFPLYHAPTVDDLTVYIPTSGGEIISLNKSEFFENWTYKFSGPAASSVLVTNNYIYFPTLAKNLYILDKKTGEQLQLIKLEGRARSIPIIKDGKLFIACEDEDVNIFAISE